MANHAKTLSLRGGDREILESMTRGKSEAMALAYIVSFEQNIRAVL
ncbi:hypothetical protein [Paeniglutamicibacter gangotriensis]|nr:hypothetical protein [Paeniglutamicibacter gangotriensis]